MRMAHALFFLNTLIWLILALTTYLQSAFSLSWILALLMLGNAAAMALAGWGLYKKDRRAYYFSLALLGVNILLTFTDQFGLLDGITLAIDLVLLGLLFFQRDRYLQKSMTKGENNS
ncbi:MAG: hypothetical protein JXB15_08845 [Anaerolineales bacterium]|nr:hypothetical protein [Anaerolineales bacterium]